MALKQISLTMPTNLLKASKEYSQEYGYKNVQEFILDLVRRRVLAKRIERYGRIEEKIDREAKAMSQKEAIKYLEGLQGYSINSNSAANLRSQ
jgi:metal-responsive CopG/Arc/MetJ family transcriptional regulator